MYTSFSSCLNPPTPTVHSTVIFHAFNSMISRCRLPPITPLPSLSQSTNQQLLPHRRVGSSTPKSGMTRTPKTHLTHLFCSSALKISATKRSLYGSKQLHSHVIKLGFYNSLSIQNQVLHSYVKCSEFVDMRNVFDEMPVRNVVTWNTVFCGGNPHVGFDFFRKMLLEMVLPDRVTVNALFRASIEMGDFELGRVVHGFAVKLGFTGDCFVGSALVELYGKLGLIKDASSVFDGIESKDLVLWNVMVFCYAFDCSIEQAFTTFRLMRFEGMKGDQFTFSTLLNCCGISKCCELGKQLQGLSIKMSFDSDVQVGSTIVDMYAKNGQVFDARKAFDSMFVRNVVSWNAMIVCYGKHGYGTESMKLLIQMFRDNTDPDELTLSSIISSCGHLLAMSELIQAHCYAIKSGYHLSLSITNALIDAYSKTGNFQSASQCFNSVTKPDLVTWTSILNAYAFHAPAWESIETFEEMLSSGINPDKLTFLAVLSSCSHGGFIIEGLRYFKSMVTEYGIMPNSEHYACLINLLSRVGLVDEGLSILKAESFGFELGSDALGAFMGACKVHGHVKLAEWVAKKLTGMESGNDVNYNVLSNMYASAGKWGDAERVRRMMKNTSNVKVPGCSWVENVVVGNA